MAAETFAEVYFGGPDLTKNLLRDTLLEQIEISPPQAEILWVCYYLNDPKIIQALSNAARRGVDVSLIIDANPRTPAVNQPAIKKLSALINITAVKHKPVWQYLGINWHARLHSKLYYFSRPRRCVYLGSYNPTAGLQASNLHTVEKIGDHALSHNVLVKIEQQALLDVLYQHALTLKNNTKRAFARWLNSRHPRPAISQWQVFFLPAIQQHPIDRLLCQPDNNASLKCAVSHLTGPGVLRPLKKALKLNKKVELLLPFDQRRIAARHLLFLRQHAIGYYQLKSDANGLMHNKFIIYQSENQHCVMFGSFNWSTRSRLLNHEVIACTHDKTVVAAFELRWRQMLALT